MRQAVRQQVVSRSETIVPPVRGWIANEPLANSKPGGAFLLENWFPTRTSVRVRGGSQRYANVSDIVRCLFTYKSGSQEVLFAADDTQILDISNVADPDEMQSAYDETATLRDTCVVGQTAGYYSSAQFGTAGGDFLSVVNGADTPLYFDGSTWTAHTFTGLATPEQLSFVWVYGNRLWYIQQNTLKVWYPPVDSINGALTELNLAGVFQEGGSLLMGGRWSIDAGNGLDDKWFAITTTGEVAVFEGTDPGDATNWSLVGLYKISRPLGPKAISYAGGDPLIATEDGIVPLSEAVNKDTAALSLAAITKQIEPDWKREVAARGFVSWELMKWPSNNMMVVGLPVVSGTDDYCFVCNVETGAWTKFTGWDTQCLIHYGGQGFFGSSTGKVYRMEVGGTDDGAAYTCRLMWLPDHLKRPGAIKTIHSARTTVRATFNPVLKLSAVVNYAETIPSAPGAGTGFASNGQWDVSLWDVGIWDAPVSYNNYHRWASIGKTGYSVSLQLQVTCNFTPKPELELIATDVMYETGAVMV